MTIPGSTQQSGDQEEAELIDRSEIRRKATSAPNDGTSACASRSLCIYVHGMYIHPWGGGLIAEASAFRPSRINRRE
jgi:hypothetical protein